jgi:excisionase family DNA binding protein
VDCREEFFHDDALRALKALAQQVRVQNEEIRDVGELAAYLRTHENTIYAMVKDGRLPAIKVGREWRFRKQTINSLFEGEPRPESSELRSL